MTTPSGPDPISPGKSVEQTANGMPQGTAKDFGPFMRDQAQGDGGPRTNAPTPMSLSQGSPNPTGAPPTLDSIQAQAKTMQDGLGQVGDQLKSENLKLKRSQTHLLKNKLTEAQEHIRGAAQKLGINSPPMKMPQGAGPINRFIAYVNDGQDQLIQVQNQLKKMSAKGGQLSAAEMLAVTVKMNLAQQEIEYSTTLLGKVMDSVKQVMNIQL